nr:unnamed protein product [Hydra vulgaris]
VKQLPNIGINQNVIGIIDKTSCLFCQTYIDIPIMIHFENNNRSSCNLFQTLWNDVDKICNTESIVTECVNWIDYCNWTNSDYVNTNSCYNSTCTPVCFVDINECKNWIDYCNLANSDCVNINGSDNSTCESGWSLENNSFVVVNKSNELDKWTNSDCENINEIYNCTCKSGWSLVKDRCVDELIEEQYLCLLYNFKVTL